MVAIVSRMRRLRTLLDVRLGPGAALLSGDVQRIHLNFARKINDGHMGPRKFWHHYLPRLKYHNPAIPMTVERTENQEGPATLTIFFNPRPSNDSSSTNPTSKEGIDEATSETKLPEISKSIDMKHKKEGAILSELLRLTGGKPIIATPEELEQLKALEDDVKASEEDRAIQQAYAKEQKRQADLLANARRSSYG